MPLPLLAAAGVALRAAAPSIMRAAAGSATRAGAAEGGGMLSNLAKNYAMNKVVGGMATSQPRNQEFSAAYSQPSSSGSRIASLASYNSPYSSIASQDAAVSKASEFRTGLHNG